MVVDSDANFVRHRGRRGVWASFYTLRTRIYGRRPGAGLVGALLSFPGGRIPDVAIDIIL